MSALGVWIFPEPGQAEAALRVVERLQVQRKVSVDDAAVVEWEPGRARPSAYQVGTAAGTAALSGAYWGLLVGMTLLLPLAGETGAGLPGLGLPEAVLARLRSRIVPGTSALLLLTADVDVLGEALAHGDPVVSTLDRGQEAALRRAFGSDDL
jgi:uncharacterized membrane protein